MKFLRSCRRPVAAMLALGLITGGPARANPALVVDAATGEVIFSEFATAPWFPASTTKLMTTYVALSKVKEGRISLDTPLRVSVYAASMIPSKMGFRPGTLVTLDNALKMLMVKSPNDIAVTIAEGISGSVPAFADEMNAYGAKLGLRESHFMNPNGLPDPQHVSSARDMALIARALIRDFPEEHDLFDIAALQLGNTIIPNHNGLLGRYPGVDGMKTGFTCAAGYNVVETATRGDKRLIVVIMGAPSTNERNLKAVTLFERAFASPGGGLGDLASLPSSEVVMAPDLHGQVCGPGRHDAIAEAEAEDAALNPTPTVPPGAPGAVGISNFGKTPERADVVAMAAAEPATPLSGPAALLKPRGAVIPVRVFIGVAPGANIPPVGSIEVAVPGPRAGRAKNPAASAPSVATAPEAGAATAAPVDPALAAPLALAGATVAPALAAANKAVKGRGRLSLRVEGAARTRPVASAKPRPAVKIVRKAVPAKPRPAAKPGARASAGK